MNNGTTSGNAERKPDPLSRFKIEESRARSLANLRPWTRETRPKSPGRRPHPIVREIERALRSHLSTDDQQRSFATLVAQALVRKAAKGDVPAISLLLERLLGKPKMPEDIERPSTIIVQINRNVPRDFRTEDYGLKNS